MNAETLLELAARCVAATGPDRELDCDIAVAALGFFTLPPRYEGGDVLYCYKDDKGVTNSPGQAGDMLVRHFTASLDAAMTLVPERWSVAQIGEWYDTPLRAKGQWFVALYRRLVRINDGGSGGAADPYARCEHARSAALALTAAALRAHANRETNNG